MFIRTQQLYVVAGTRAWKHSDRQGDMSWDVYHAAHETHTTTGHPHTPPHTTAHQYIPSHTTAQEFCLY